MSFRVISVIVGFFAVYSGCANAEDKPMDFLTATFQGKPCEVYFFRTWATYSHPVKPIDPIRFEDALKRDAYYRAWMCTIGKQNLFVFFEGVELSKTNTAIPKQISDDGKIHLYEAKEGTTGVERGKALSSNATATVDSFLVSYPEKTTHLIHVKQKSVVTYEYQYDAKGKLTKVLVKDFDGNIKAINY